MRSLIILLVTLILGDGFLQDGEKLKLEESFLADAASFRNDSIPGIPDNLQRISKTMYVSDNGYYESESVRNLSFYVRSRRHYTPLCNVENPVESLTTLMTGHLPDNNYTAKITLHLYGYRTASTELPLANLLGFCLNQGCVPYVGISESDPEVVRGTLFMVNEKRGYCHTFRFMAPIVLFSTGEGSVVLDAYTYTPIHNLAK